ncbi:MAG: glycosyltransferase family 9 protein [Schleiferiaceae bacterium]|nr:glycosyltransferase family 9 protein [Schleiferiaceae bacterium]
MKLSKMAVVRFSALGDVLLLWPVMTAVAEANPTLRITFFTRSGYLPHLPSHPTIDVIGLDLEESYRNPIALNLFFYGWIRTHSPIAWVDAHAHLRTRLGTSLAAMLGTKIGRLDKHRSARKAFLNRKCKALPSIQSLYAEAFAQAGFPILWPGHLEWEQRAPSEVMILAPFSAQASKSMPLIDAAALAQRWMDHGGRVVLMASKAEAQQWQGPVVETPALEEELVYWKSAAVAVVTDSANQHLAALHGTPSVTLWMGTSPQAGFAPRQLSLHRDLVPTNLACFPCSIYGKSSCSRSDFACKNHSPDSVWEAIQEVASVPSPSFF